MFRNKSSKIKYMYYFFIPIYVFIHILHNWWLSMKWIQGLINPWNMIFTEASVYSYTNSKFCLQKYCVYTEEYYYTHTYNDIYRITSVLKVEKDIITSITVSLTGRTNDNVCDLCLTPTLAVFPLYMQIGHFLFWFVPLKKCRSLNWPRSTKKIRSVHNSHAPELTLILKIVSQCE
jgi:hypothetical protein